MGLEALNRKVIHTNSGCPWAAADCCKLHNKSMDPQLLFISDMSSCNMKILPYNKFC
jgi:hypothetical protein